MSVETELKEFSFTTKCRVCGKKHKVQFEDGSRSEAVRNLRTRAMLLPDLFHESSCPSKKAKNLKF